MRKCLEKTVRPVSNRVTLLLVVVLVAMPSCRTQVKRPASAPIIDVGQPASSSQNSSETEMSLIELIKQWPFLEKEKREGMLRAWARVPKNERYRAARARDFENPFMTSDYGEIAGAFGLATLIVDKTITTAQRFSLVIFIERPGNRYDIYWIYRDMDLSKYNMSRASGDIFVEEVHEDGSKSVCEIRWDKTKRQWACGGL